MIPKESRENAIKSLMAAGIGVNEVSERDETKINHVSCGDTRKRLYLNRKSYGVVFYCHNCNDKGVLMNSKAQRLKGEMIKSAYGGKKALTATEVEMREEAARHMMEASGKLMNDKLDAELEKLLIEASGSGTVTGRMIAKHKPKEIWNEELLRHYKDSLMSGSYIIDSFDKLPEYTFLDIEEARDHPNAVSLLYGGLGPGWLTLAEKSGIKYVPEAEGLFYPKGNGGGQIRKLVRASKYDPKYITVKGDPEPCPLTPVGNIGFKPLLFVLTEDYLSAVRVSQHIGCYGVPVWGANKSIELLHGFITNHVHDGCGIVVWLDNDSDIIVNQAVKIESMLKTLVPKTSSVQRFREQMEPKHMTEGQLESVLKTYMEVCNAT